MKRNWNINNFKIFWFGFEYWYVNNFELCFREYIGRYRWGV